MTYKTTTIFSMARPGEALHHYIALKGFIMLINKLIYFITLILLHNQDKLVVCKGMPRKIAVLSDKHERLFYKIFLNSVTNFQTLRVAGQ